MSRVNWKKFETLVHYICQKASDPSVLGAVKLNKVLWYSDAVFYMIHGESITGETYIKRQHGPVPRHILRAVDNLVASRKIARGKTDYFGFYKTEYIAIEDASLDMFSATEIALVDEAFEHVCLNHTARSISEETHGLIWQSAELGEEIPLATVFAATEGEIDEDDMAWAKSELSRGQGSAEI